MRAPTPDPNWPDDVRALYAHDTQEIWDPTIAPQVWFMYHEELRRYRRAASSAGCPLRVLDVGCAQGTLALLLAEDGHDVVAMDIRPQFIEYAKSRYERGNIRLVAANVMEYATEDRFDLIFVNQVLEHIVNPVEVVRRLGGWLSEGGRLVVTTPNGRYIRSALPTFRQLGDPSRYQDRQFSADGDGHFFAYTAQELETVVRDAGLLDVFVKQYASPWVTGHVRFRYLQPLVPDALLRSLDAVVLRLPGLRTAFGYQLWAEGRRA